MLRSSLSEKQQMEWLVTSGAPAAVIMGTKAALPWQTALRTLRPPF